MRPLRFVFLLSIFIGISLHLSAQNQGPTTCDGSLGDPVINQDFGSGQNPGPALPSSTTNMLYTTNACPNDGQYTIVNALDPTCHYTWQLVPHDHTGNPNGYMMIVNASQYPSVFFTQSAPTLCPGTTYQFSAWILNLITKATADGGGNSEPDITFEVDGPDGKAIATYDTGTIQPTNTPTWVQESLYFITPDDATSVTVKMTNNAPGGNGNDLVLDDITFRACGPMINAGFGSINGGQAQTLCQGSNADYTFMASVTGNNNPNYQWQDYNNTTNAWEDIAGATSSSYTAHIVNAAAGTDQYRVGITNGTSTAASCRVYSKPLTVTVNAAPVITGVPPTQTLCAGDQIVLSASGGTSYKWTGPNLSSTQNPITINNATSANTGTYTVTAYNQYDCSSTATTNVSVNPLPVPTVTGGGITICSGDKTQIAAEGGTTYSWSPGKTLSDSTIANPIASPIDTTIYRVTVTNQFGCSAIDSVTINVEKKAISNAGTNKVIFEGQSTKLNGSEQYGGSYYWTPDSALSDPTSLTPIASPTNDITYTLHVKSTNNCGDDSSSIFVKVYKKITIPNTFSPNGDGVNDKWDIDALITYPNCLLQVFDRYGQLVYKSIGYNQPWDGKYDGRILPTGTYYYILDLKNNTPKLSGWLLIVK